LRPIIGDITLMARTLSATAKAAIFAQTTSEAFIMLVTINHSSFTTPIRVSSDPTQDLPVAAVRGTVSNGVEYIFLPFAINLPTQDDTGLARAQISVDNISREIVAAVRGADSALSIDIDIVLSSDPDTVEVNIADFRLDRVTYDAFTVSGDISVEYFDLEPFPTKRFTPADFPALF